MTGSSQFSVQIVRTKNVVRGDLSQRYFTPNTVLAVLASLAAAALTTPVSAQENEPFLEEIIVTAQKRADNLQDTSLSITAFSADRLNQLGIENVTDLRNAVPGLTINDSVTPFISIRGVSSNSDLPTGDPAVATHINGVYVGRPSATRGAFYDLERIEVLRGPQGILYGRNATGGSINIISRRPDFERAANFKTELGNFSRYGISGAANVVLAEDELALRVAATYDQRDSFANTGAVSDRSYGNALDELGFRIQALYAPNEDSSLLLGYSKYTNDGGVAASTVIPAPAGYDPFNVSLNTEPIFEDDQDMFWLEANYELDWAQFTYLGSWFDNSIFNQTDFDGGDMLQQIGLRHLSGEQVSHEFRLSSVSGDEWDWLVGLYYFDEDSTRAVDVDLGFIQIDVEISDFNAESFAFFGSVTRHFGNGYRLSAGLRYSDDEKTETDSTRTAIVGGMPVFAEGSQNGSWDSTDWQLTLEKDVDEDHLLYAKVGTGYKAGGFVDAISAILTMTADPLYDNEEVFAIELGHKSYFFNNRLRVNSAIYHYDYSDQQVLVFFAGGNIVENADSEIFGIETEIQAAPNANSLISLAIGYTDAEYDNGVLLVDGTRMAQRFDVGGNRLPRAPELTFNLSAQYSFALDSGATLTPSINFHWEDDTQLRPFELALDEQDSWTETDLRLSYEAANSKWSADVWVKNLEDPDGDDVVGQAIQVTGTGGRTADFRMPRTYGVGFRYRF